MDAAPEVVLTALIALSGLFQDGLTAFKQERYADAAKAFTAVIEHKFRGNPLRAQALLYRARSRTARGQRAKAKADYVTLLTTARHGPTRRRARREFGALGGRQKDLLPEESPTEVWRQFHGALSIADVPAAISLSTGLMKRLLMQSYRDEVGSVGFTPRFWARAQPKVVRERTGRGAQFGTAWVDVNMHFRGNAAQALVYIYTFELTLHPATGTWRVSSMAFSRQRVQPEDPTEADVRRQNAGDLRLLFLACTLYAADHDGRLPRNLDQLQQAGIIEDETGLRWRHPQTHLEQLGYIYRPGLKLADKESDSAGQTLLAATPRAFAGQRQTLFLDGHVKRLDEERFQGLALQQNWDVPSPQAPAVSPDIQQQVDRLVADLASDDFRTRQNALKALKELGPAAYPALQKYLDDDDPEVKLGVRRVMGL